MLKNSLWTCAKQDIPSNIWEAAQISDTQEKQYCMDVIWGYLKSKPPLLPEIALSVLVIPHSNAGEESLFDNPNEQNRVPIMTSVRGLVEFHHAHKSVNPKTPNAMLQMGTIQRIVEEV